MYFFIAQALGHRTPTFKFSHPKVYPLNGTLGGSFREGNICVKTGPLGALFLGGLNMFVFCIHYRDDVYWNGQHKRCGGYEFGLPLFRQA